MDLSLLECHVLNVDVVINKDINNSPFCEFNIAIIAYFCVSVYLVVCVCLLVSLQIQNRRMLRCRTVKFDFVILLTLKFNICEYGKDYCWYFSVPPCNEQHQMDISPYLFQYQSQGLLVT